MFLWFVPSLSLLLLRPLTTRQLAVQKEKSTTQPINDKLPIQQKNQFTVPSCLNFILPGELKRNLMQQLLVNQRQGDAVQFYSCKFNFNNAIADLIELLRNLFKMEDRLVQTQSHRSYKGQLLCCRQQQTKMTPFLYIRVADTTVVEHRSSK